MALTQWYLQRGIRDQISIGFSLICCVSSYFACIIYCLYVYGMLVYSLNLQLNFLETNEYSRLESLISFTNQQLFLYEEISKLSIQVIREVVNTFDTGPPLYPSASFKPKENCLSVFNELCYLGDLAAQTADCTNFKGNVFQLLPILKAIDDIQLPWLGTNKLLTNISIYVEQCQITYAVSKEALNSKVYYQEVEAEFKNMSSRFIKSFSSGINSLLKDYYLSKGVDPTDPTTLNAHPSIEFATCNCSSVVKLPTYGLTVVNGVLIKDFLAYFSEKVLRSVSGYSLLITRFDLINQREKVISHSSCLYLLIVQSIGQSDFSDMITDTTINKFYETISSIGDNFTIDNCFLEPQAKNDMNELAYTNDTDPHVDLYLTNNFYQKRLISLGQYHFVSSQASESNLYEVIKSSFPDSNVLIAFHSAFVKYQQYYFYSLYPHFPFDISTLPMRDRQANLICFLIIILLVLWRIINIGIYYIMKKISSDVTKPLNKLKTAVETMTLKDDSKLEFKDDDDINDLFDTCKDILKGALVIHKGKNDQKESKGLLKDMSSNIIVNQAKVDDNPVKTHILNCSSKWIMTYDKSKDKEKASIERISTQADKECDANKKDFLHLAEVICTLRNKKDNILFTCYAKLKQDKLPPISSTTIVSSPNSMGEKKNSQMNISSMSSIKKKKLEFREEENKTISID